MKTITFSTLFSVILLFACAGQKANESKTEPSKISAKTPSETLYQVFKKDSESEEFCFINQAGDTIVPFGRFSYSFHDTITTYGVVFENSTMIGINPEGERLYEVYMFDNGPDYIEDGLFRIKEDGKVGYADGETGEVVITPQYGCAYPFEEGKAKVALECELEKDGEYTTMKSDSWFMIDTKGEKVE